jgi:hypothetical protein
LQSRTNVGRFNAIMPVNKTKLLPGCKAASVGFLMLGLFQSAARGEWQRDDKGLAWVSGTNVFWRFSFDPAKGKPFFHPLAPSGNIPLTNFKPVDHPWHYALWFSWKYINHPNDPKHVNYWEENSTGNARAKPVATLQRSTRSRTGVPPSA